MKDTILDLIKRTYDEWRTDGAPQIAAALTYYTLLSVAPLLVVLVSVAGRVLGRATVTEQVLSQAEVLAGELGRGVARELLSVADLPTLSTLTSAAAIAVAIFGAMRVFRQLRTAFDRMWDIPSDEPPDGDFWTQVRWGLSALGKQNLAAFLMVLAVGGLLLAALAASSAITVAATHLAPLLTLGSGTLRVLDFVVSVLLITALFAIVYRYLPRTSIGWKDVWLGAAITSLLFTIGRLALGLYFTQASPGSAYGAAGSVVVLLVWVNFSSQLALFGAEFTHVWAYTHGSRSDRSERAAEPETGDDGDEAE
ncbi:MAG: YihY/virulence factor BrkB family protein [Coriobacteriia bacterium]